MRKKTVSHDVKSVFPRIDSQDCFSMMQEWNGYLPWSCESSRWLRGSSLTRSLVRNLNGNWPEQRTSPDQSKEHFPKPEGGHTLNSFPPRSNRPLNPYPNTQLCCWHSCELINECPLFSWVSRVWKTMENAGNEASF
jgi:hypothetical protein